MPPNSIKNIVIIGATSTIAAETAGLYAKTCSKMFLVSRNKTKLQTLSTNLKKNTTAIIYQRTADITETEIHNQILNEAWKSLETVDLLLVCHGSLSDQKKCEASFERTREEFSINFLSVISLMVSATKYFSQAQKGTIAVIGSVAGDRGRQSNYTYGAAKGALAIYMEGMRNRLHAKGVHILTIKPGFIRTQMTAHLKQNFLYSHPKVVARGIVRAVQKRKDTVYIPGWWFWIMLIIKCIPEFIFKRLKF